MPIKKNLNTECIYCHEPISQNAKFCKFCGQKQGSETNDFEGDILIINGGIFKGRLNRREYWLGNFILTVIAIIWLFVTGFLSGLFFSNGEGAWFESFSTIILSLAYFIFLWSITVRRIHDLNQSGWSLLLGLIPIVNLIWALAILFVSGTNDSNKYGLEPNREIKLKTIFKL